MRQRICSHLTYANVMATLAVFIVLGGVGYAAATINGKDIKKHSEPGNRLKKHTLTSTEMNRKLIVPRARVANRAKRVHISGEGKTRRGKLSQATAAQAASGGSLVKLSTGETQTLFEAGPFTFTATCTDEGGGDFKVAIKVTSSVDNWVGGEGVPPPVHNAGDVAVIDEAEGTGPGLSESLVREIVAAQSGEAVTLGIPSLGTHILGADCVADLYAVG